MPLIRKGRVAAHDWHLIEESGTIPPGDIVVGLPKLLTGEETWRLRPGRLGVEITGDTDLRVLTPWLDRLSLIVVRFDAFTDGRGFSLARRLRASVGYTGEIWARGALISDQYSFALQCGFDAVLADEAVFARQGGADAWAGAARALSLSYQSGQLAGAAGAAGATGSGSFGRPRSIPALRRAARFSTAAE